jgi:uncharacterized membrane protein
MKSRAAGTAALLLGVGMGGFWDGIALHQIAQWHNMLSARIPPHTMDAMKTNMAADGWFHVATWVITLIGVFKLWDVARNQDRPLPNTRWFVGYMLLGWGAFNLVEGTIDHHLLQLHHVRDLPQHIPAYDWVFLLFGGFLLILIGWFLRSERSNSLERPK